MEKDREAFDTIAWRRERDQKLMEWLGNANAVQLFVAVSTIAETWDDMIDGDKRVEAWEIHQAFIAALVDLELNSFYQQHKAFLFPLIVSAIDSYLNSVALESETGDARVHAYTLRLQMLNLLPTIAFLLGGFNHMRKVSLASWKFFTKHDSFGTWLEECNGRRIENSEQDYPGQ